LIMQVMVAMSGGVDSSVAAAMLRDEGHEIVGVTLKLWGGESDSGCCSVSDVDDARRVAQQLDIDHLVFNFSEDFDRDVVEPYVADHARGITPNPCIECNRHLKFDRLMARADALGFDMVATGHHAQIVRSSSGLPRLTRGADFAKDQSYVGGLTKDEVRERATELGLRTAGKPDSQDVCFISHTGGGRRVFLGNRIDMHPARLVDETGTQLGSVDAVELVTIGQRRGLGIGIDGRPRYALDVDVPNRTVLVGAPEGLDVSGELLHSFTWVDESARSETLISTTVSAQASAHGESLAISELRETDAGLELIWESPTRRVAPGQSIVLYDNDLVVGGGLVSRR
jgi:tRNA-specific 2-thiouridylase